MKPLEQFEVWFLTGSQELYGEAALRQVAADAEQIARSLCDAAAIPVRVVHKPVLTSAEAIRRPARRRTPRTRASASSPGCTRSHRPGCGSPGLRALQKPLLHLHTQFNRDLPWAEIDMDFMNLHQAAHGDREFGFIGTRLGVARKMVVGHWGDPRVPERIGAWARAACGWREAHHLRVARFGDNMRQVAVTEGDKVEAQIRLGVTVNGYGVRDLVDAVRSVPDRRSKTCSAAYDASTRSRPISGPTAPGATSSARPRGSRSACAGSSTLAGSGPSPTRSRTSMA